MKKVGFIPLRKGSKGIPGKNKRKMLGRPLFSWVLAEAVFSDLDIVYVYTDDNDILNFIDKEYVWTNKIKVLERSPESATDKASTEMAMLELCEKINYDFDIFCLLQATTPQTKANHINQCLSELQSSKLKSSVSVVKTHRFTWNADGTASNYDVFNRPRRQEFEGLRIENGAIYCTEKSILKHKKNRLDEQSVLVEMPENTLQEIDSENDWTIVEQLLSQRLQQQKTNKKIKYLVLDVDGVFTDAKIHFSKDGELSKQFDMQDGMGLEILREHQVQVMVMTSEESELVAQRMKKLKIKDVYLGVKDKYARLQFLAKQKNIDLNEIAYVGDDINDLANICAVGWSLCPKNALPLIKKHADVILPSDSGNKAIRSACEFITQYNLRF